MFMNEIKALRNERAELLELILTDRAAYDRLTHVIRRIDQAIALREELAGTIKLAA